MGRVRSRATRGYMGAREPRPRSSGSLSAHMRTLLALTLVVVASACQQSTPSVAAPTSAAPAAKPIQVVMGQAARTFIAAGATLVDVRTVDEFAELHVEGAKNIPLHELGRSLGNIPKDKPVIVYCAVGSRSASAAEFLARAGYDVKDLGAMGNWNR